jgi:hypothetical protein
MPTKTQLLSQAPVKKKSVMMDQKLHRFRKNTNNIKEKTKKRAGEMSGITIQVRKRRE